MNKDLKDLFGGLVKSLTEQKLVTEEKSADMISAFSKKLDEAKVEIYEEALEAATEKLDADYGQKLEEILEKLDADCIAKLKQVIDAIDQDHGAKAKEMIAAALEKQDEEHGEKLDQVVNTLDAQATDKLTQVVDKLDDEATEKLKAVKEYYETKYMDVITEKLDKYFEAYLEEVQPKEVVLDAAKLERLSKSIDAIKEILMINDDYVQSEVKEAVVEAKSIIEEKDSQINNLMLQIAEVKRTEKAKDAKAFLESKIASASPKLKSFLEVTFKNSSKEEIQDKFDEAVTQFKKEETATRDSLIAENKDKGVKPANVITENLVQNLNVNPLMDKYVKLISKTC